MLRMNNTQNTLRVFLLWVQEEEKRRKEKKEKQEEAKQDLGKEEVINTFYLILMNNGLFDNGF